MCVCVKKGGMIVWRESGHLNLERKFERRVGAKDKRQTPVIHIHMRLMESVDSLLIFDRNSVNRQQRNVSKSARLTPKT